MSGEQEQQEPRIKVTKYAGADHSAATTVFTRRTDSEVFHADKHCHRLHQGGGYTFDGEEIIGLNAHTLSKVMTTYLDPVKPCSYCTQDIEKSAELAVKYGDVSEAELKFYRPGDKRVNEQYSRNSDGEMTLTNRSISEVY